VPTVIKFIGAADNSIVVSEDAEAVGHAMGEARDRPPARFTSADGGALVYVNPSAVACWSDGAMPRREDSGIASSMSPF
jgi:hypothetical protein